MIKCMTVLAGVVGLMAIISAKPVQKPLETATEHIIAPTIYDQQEAGLDYEGGTHYIYKKFDGVAMPTFKNDAMYGTCPELVQHSQECTYRNERMQAWGSRMARIET